MVPLGNWDIGGRPELAGVHLTLDSSLKVSPQVLKFSTLIQNTREMGRARLPNILPIDGTGKLLVPPYVLGAWLGDGHVGCSRVTSGDDELIAVWSGASVSTRSTRPRTAQPKKCPWRFVVSVTPRPSSASSRRRASVRSRLRVSPIGGQGNSSPNWSPRSATGP